MAEAELTLGPFCVGLVDTNGTVFLPSFLLDVEDGIVGTGRVLSGVPSFRAKFLAFSSCSKTIASPQAHHSC